MAVKKKPKAYVDLLMAESAVINAAIDLGTERSIEAANRFGKTVHLNLRKVYGMDLQSLGVGTLEEATRVLSQSHVSGGDDLSDTGTLQNSNVTSDVPARGAQTRGSLARKMAITGVPTAAARCAMPESLPM